MTLVRESARALVRCDRCGLTVAARLVGDDLRYGPPAAWRTVHRGGYSEGADAHFCPACVERERDTSPPAGR